MRIFLILFLIVPIFSGCGDGGPVGTVTLKNGTTSSKVIISFSYRIKGANDWEDDLLPEDDYLEPNASRDFEIKDCDNDLEFRASGLKEDRTAYEYKDLELLCEETVELVFK